MMGHTFGAVSRGYSYFWGKHSVLCLVTIVTYGVNIRRCFS